MSTVLTVRLRADGRGLTGTLQSGGRELQRFGTQLETARTRSLSLARSSGTLIGSLGSLKSLLPALGLAILIRGSAMAAESLRSMEARVRRATESLNDINRVQRELYEISQRNGTVLQETGNLFLSISRAAEDLGRSRGEVLQLTDSIQQLGVISDASGEAMRNSLRQFSQSMAGGVVRAEEFNSIIENTPELAVRIAKGMDMTVGQLRLAVNEGKVLSETVFDSLLKQSDEIRADFEKMPLTIERAWTALKNSLSRFIAGANEASGATGGVADSIKGVADAIDDLNRRVSSGEFSAEIALWMELWTDFKKIAGQAVDFVSNKLSGGVIEWGEFLMDLPALMKISFTEVFAWVDWGVAEINTIWQKLPLLWDKLWLNIRKKGREWWAQITNIFSSDDSLGSAMAEIQKEYSEAVGPINEDLKALDAAYESAKKASLDTAAAIREEQEARMANRRQLEQTAKEVGDTIAAYEIYDGALNDHIQSQTRTRKKIVETNVAIKEQSVWSKAMSGAIAEFTGAWDEFYGKLEGRYRASVDDMLELWDKFRGKITGTGESGSREVDRVTESIFDMEEALKNVQNNVHRGFSDMFYDVFSGKGIDSVKDFAKRTLDIFKRLAADIAAAFAAKKVFGWFGIDTGSINLGGGGSGTGSASGAIVNTGIKAAIEKSGIGQSVSAAISKGVLGVKSFFGLGGGSTTSAVPGALGSVKGPAVLNYAGGASSSAALGGQGAAAIGNGYGGGAVGGNAAASGAGAGWGAAAGAAFIAAIGVYGFGKQARKQRQRAERQAEFFSQVGTGTNEAIGESAVNFRGMLDESTAFFSATEAGWQSTAKALQEIGLLSDAWGASLDENGNALFRVQGNIDGARAALEQADATMYRWHGNFKLAEEKSNALRVSVVGDADQIRAAMETAAAESGLSFTAFQETASGASAVLAGDLRKWDEILQGIVESSLSAVTGQINSAAGAASNLTREFERAAGASRSISIGSTIGGGRAGQVDGSHRDGLPMVPFDGYRAILHYGERVLNAEENLEYRRLVSRRGERGSAPVVDIRPLLAEQQATRAEITRLVESNQQLERTVSLSDRRNSLVGSRR